MSRRRVAALVLVLALQALAASAQLPDAPARLTDIAVRSVGDAVTVSVATTGAPRYRSELMDGPFRLVLDFEGTLYHWQKAPLGVGLDPVKAIRASQFRKGVARVVIELTRKAPYRVEPHAGGIRVVFAPPAEASGPPAPAPAAPMPAAPAKPTGPPTWRLQGIVVSDDTSIAYIADPATNQVRRYAIGDRIGDGLVESIEERRVVLRMPRGAVELRLEERRPVPRPRP